jgi:hypothetical protein
VPLAAKELLQGADGTAGGQRDGFDALALMDGYFTNAPILNYIHGKKLSDGRSPGHVGSLKFNRKLQYKGRSVKVAALAAQTSRRVDRDTS